MPDPIDALRAAVGDSHVLIDPDLTAPHVVDWTHRFGGPALAVVRPGSTAEVAAVLGICRAAGIAVVPQGGNTGLVGGGVPRSTGSPPVVLLTTRLDQLGPVDELARQVTAGAGVTIGRLQRHVASRRLAYGVDLASRESATVGGSVATNAGGLHVIAAGDTRAQVVGLEVVLADGSVLSRLSGLAKDSTGYDLSGLLVGSEGTLGVITAARFRLHAARRPPTTTLIGVSSVADALALVPRTGVHVAEVMFAAGIELVCAVARLPPPARAGVAGLPPARDRRSSGPARRRRRGRRPTAQGVPRAAHRGDRHARCAAQARCRRSGRSRPRACRGGRGRRA